MAKWYPLKKIERQLLIYHIFIHNQCVQYDTIRYWLKFEDSQLRTFYRDLKELNDSGLITTVYNHELKAYTDSGRNDINSKASGVNIESQLASITKISIIYKPPSLRVIINHTLIIKLIKRIKK